MHGSPLSRFDNKILWRKYNYKDLGIIGEPYLDTDWNEWGYLTDTGRRWNGGSVSIRDKVDSKYNLNFETTYDIINNIDDIPCRLMITIHPQRWNDDLLKWLRELIFQFGKNFVKKILLLKAGKRSLKY